MRVRFWGTRGSIAKAGPTTVRYGGNTSCVEVRSADGTLVVLDCGTGAHGLGQALVKGPQPVNGSILIGHTHWDHIQGMPFFAPLFVAGNEWNVYAPRGLGEHLEDTLAAQMQYTYFPVSLQELSATIHYRELVEETFSVGGIEVTSQYLNHPLLTLGYRLVADGVTIVYATDHEPHSRHLATPSTATRLAPGFTPDDRRHCNFLAKADLLIHDAQYLASEYPSKLGWGHSTIEYVVGMAAEAQVKRLALFHHDPMRHDDALDDVVALARAQAQRLGAKIDIFGACEQEELELIGRRTPTSILALEATIAAAPPDRLQSVLVVMSDPARGAVLEEAVNTDGTSLLAARDAASALRLAREEFPCLVLLDRQLADADALELCRTLTSSPDFADRNVAVVLVSSQEDADLEAGFEAGAIDWLIRPYTLQYARTKIRSWLLRGLNRGTRELPEIDIDPSQAVQRFEDMPSGELDDFGVVLKMAERIFSMPIALFSLFGAETQEVLTPNKLCLSTVPRSRSICALVLAKNDLLVIPDTHREAGLGSYTLLTDHAIRSYAGVPVRDPSGQTVGVLAVMDRRQREFEDAELLMLRSLAKLAEHALEHPAAQPV